MADNLRLRRADPNALPAVTERLRPPKLHVHLHQLRRLVRRAVEKLPEEHHLPRRQRGGVLGSEEQAQRSTRRLQGMGFHETSDKSFWPKHNQIVSDGTGRLEDNLRAANGEALPASAGGLPARGLRDAPPGLRLRSRAGLLQLGLRF